MSGTTKAGMVACAAAVLSLMEPRLAFLGPWCSLVCLGLVAWSSWAGLHFGLLPALVGLFSGIIASTGYNLEADSRVYMAATASLVQDLDLDVGNQYMAWFGWSLSRGPAGMSIIQQPVGSAFVWAMPALVAHAYTLLAGGSPANFFSAPYFGAIIATNLAIALSGAIALARLLAPAVGWMAAGLAVASSILASPIVYYLAVQPLMVHGLVFGFTCWAIVLLVRAVEADRDSNWRWAGVVVGLAALCRFQAAVLFALIPLLGWTSSRRFARRMLNASIPAVIMLLPQVIVSLKTFGRPFAMPQRSGFMNWGSPHWVETLFSADRGLFNWHPTLILGFIGLLLVRGGLQRLAWSGLGIFALTVWVNGAVLTFDGGDAFGGRRYDLAIPFSAVGLSGLLAAVRPVLQSRPLVLPALFLGLAGLWNVSFMTFYREKAFRITAPIDELAAAQAGRLHQLARAVAGFMGPLARFRVYDAFVARYTYRGFHPGGDFDLSTLEPLLLRDGWSDAKWWDDGSTFRYLLYPKACIVIPLDGPADLKGSVLARSPARIKDQRLTLTLNGLSITSASLPPAWTEIPFDAPQRLWIAGENVFCMVAEKRRPGDGGDDLSYAAAVVRVQLP